MRIDRSKLALLPPLEAAAKIGAAVELGELRVEDGLELARSLRLPENMRLALERTLRPSEKPAAVLRAQLFLPAPGKKYPIEISGKTAFHVSFGPKLSREISEGRLRLDPSTGRLLDRQGRPDPRCPVNRAQKYYLELTGREPPPWIFLHPGASTFCRPQQQVELELGRHTIQIRDQGPVKFLFSHRLDDAGELRRWTPEELAPLANYQPLVARTAHATISAPNQRALEKLTELFEKIVEPAARRRTRPASLTAEEIMRREAPIELVVVPRGKHYSAMPQVADIREVLQSKKALGDAATILLQNENKKGFVRYVFVPEEDLSSTAARDTKHELYHVLEDAFLSEDTLAAVDALWRRTVRKEGPFSRAYGMQREEFFTTMSEEFEGSHGDEGRRWLSEHHPELEEIFRRVTRPILN